MPAFRLKPSAVLSAIDSHKALTIATALTSSDAGDAELSAPFSSIRSLLSHAVAHLALASTQGGHDDREPEIASALSGIAEARVFAASIFGSYISPTKALAHLTSGEEFHYGNAFRYLDHGRGVEYTRGRLLRAIGTTGRRVAELLSAKGQASPQADLFAQAADLSPWAQVINLLAQNEDDPDLLVSIAQEVQAVPALHPNLPPSQLELSPPVVAGQIWCLLSTLAGADLAQQVCRALFPDIKTMPPTGSNAKVTMEPAAKERPPFGFTGEVTKAPASNRFSRAFREQNPDMSQPPIITPGLFFTRLQVEATALTSHPELGPLIEEVRSATPGGEHQRRLKACIDQACTERQLEPGSPAEKLVAAVLMELRNQLHEIVSDIRQQERARAKAAIAGLPPEVVKALQLLKKYPDLLDQPPDKKTRGEEDPRH